MIKQLIAKVVDGRDLRADAMEQAIDAIFRGEVSPRADRGAARGAADEGRDGR